MAENQERWIFRDWDWHQVSRKRIQLKEQIKTANRAIRVARKNIATVPRQVEETRNLLNRLLSRSDLVNRIDRLDADLQSSADSDRPTPTRLENLKNELEEKQGQLSEFLGGISGGDFLQPEKPPHMATSAVFDSLDLAENLIGELQAKLDRQEAENRAIDPELKQDMDSLSGSFLQGLRAIRRSFIQSGSLSILDEDLNRLQHLLDSIRYRVTVVRRVSTLERLEAKVEQILETVNSITADQKSVFSLVHTTVIEIERWMQQFSLESPVPFLKWLPIGWLVWYVPNRLEDARYLLRQLSGSRGDYLTSNHTTKGRILAGLSVSLISWLSFTFVLSLSLLALRALLRNATLDRADRLLAANAQVEAVSQRLETYARETLPVSSAGSLPTGNETVVNRSITQLEAVISLAAEDESDLEGCRFSENREALIEQGASGELIDICRRAIAALAEVPAEGEDQLEIATLQSLTEVPGEEEGQLEAEILQSLAQRTLQVLEESLLIDARLKAAALGENGEDGIAIAVANFPSSLRNQLREELQVDENLTYLLRIIDRDAESEIRPDAVQGDTPEQQLENLLNQARLISAEYDDSGEVFSALFQWARNPIYTANINRLLLALLAGAIGATISILTRLEATEKEQQLTSPFLYGLLQPTIGAAFSAIVMMILSTGLVDVIKILPTEFHLRNLSGEPLSGSETLYRQDKNGDYIRFAPETGVLTTDEVFVIIVAGFVVGFSERLAKNAFTGIVPGSGAGK